MADPARLQYSSWEPVPSSTVSRLPRIAAARLEEAVADGCCDGPVRAVEHQETQTADTVLYLAYGSNMAAATFEGWRKIRPLASTSVSVPSLDLVFDLPGLPYLEPCFANTALRRRMPKIPDWPPKFPPVPVPDPPAPAPPGGPSVPPPPPPWAGEKEEDYDDDDDDDDDDGLAQEEKASRTAAHGDPVWTGGLYAVVYEVTAQDFATILATEGGGSSYQDVLVPCLALPPAITIPEKPPLPDPPRPFLAHTLWAPQPVDKPGGGRNGDDDGDDGDDDDDGASWLHRRWRALHRRFLRFALAGGNHRPDPAYAQPSARYLQLLVDGAREHDLPPAYQQWLAALAAYHVTTCRQRVGRALLLLVFALPVAAGMAALFLWTKHHQSGGRSGKGRRRQRPLPPLWLLAAVQAQRRVLWWTYDRVFKPVFGDGERTLVADDTRRLPAAAGKETWSATRRPTETTPLCWRSDENV